MQEEKKLKVMVLSDHPLSPSGVGTQTRYMIAGLLQTGKFEFVCLGGAVKHANYEPQTVDPYGKSWVIYPVDGYGSPEMIRSLMRLEKPDILWFMTDPRFYGWLWDMEDEVRPQIPMVYYHVWDNYPYPHFNKPSYESTDVIAAISKVTDDIVKTVAPKVESHYLPHSIDTDLFRNVSDTEEIQNFRKEYYLEDGEKTVFFWNNRNARRKQSGTLIFWFKEFLDKVGHDKAKLVMHTDVKDPHGQDLEAIVRELDLVNGEIMFSQQKLDLDKVPLLYNAADCTINISDAEGFGLSTLESLACEKPIIVNMTGGLQEQVTDGEEWFGFGLEPSSKSIIGSQEIPWIYEDRLNKDDFINALEKFLNLSEEERKEMGKKGRAHVMKNYNFKNYISSWENLLLNVHEKHGSWETRKNYEAWICKEVV